MVSSESPAHPEILLLSAGRGHWRALRQVIAEWDMLNAGVPSRVQLEQSIAILLGSKLIEADDEGRFRVTRAGRRFLDDRQLRSSRSRARPSVLINVLANHVQTPAPYVLDDGTYRAAVEAYVGR